MNKIINKKLILNNKINNLSFKINLQMNKIINQKLILKNKFNSISFKINKKH